MVCPWYDTRRQNNCNHSSVVCSCPASDWQLDKCFGHVTFSPFFDKAYGQHSCTASPLISFQSPSAEFRLTLGAMALRVPVRKDWTSATVLAPRVTPRVILPKELLLPWDIEEPLPWLDLQSAAVFVVVENLPDRWETLIWPQRELVAGFLTSGRLPGVKICLNLTPAPWKLARTRGSGPVYRGTLQYENRADICCAMLEQNRQSNGLCWRGFAVITVSDLAAKFRFRFVVVQVPKSTGYHVPYLFWKLTCGMYHLPGVGWLASVKCAYWQKSVIKH